jgi:hypothetical protein
VYSQNDIFKYLIKDAWADTNKTSRLSCGSKRWQMVINSDYLFSPATMYSDKNKNGLLKINLSDTNDNFIFNNYNSTTYLNEVRTFAKKNDSIVILATSGLAGFWEINQNTNSFKRKIIQEGDSLYADTRSMPWFDCGVWFNKQWNYLNGSEEIVYIKDNLESGCIPKNYFGSADTVYFRGQELKKCNENLYVSTYQRYKKEEWHNHLYTSIYKFDLDEIEEYVISELPIMKTLKNYISIEKFDVASDGTIWLGIILNYSNWSEEETFKILAYNPNTGYTKLYGQKEISYPVPSKNGGIFLGDIHCSENGKVYLGLSYNNNETPAIYVFDKANGVENEVNNFMGYLRFAKSYPNPARETVTIEFYTHPENINNIECEVFDYTGVRYENIQFNYSLNPSNGKGMGTVNIGRLPKGLYYVTISIKGRKVSKAIIKE